MNGRLKSYVKFKVTGLQGEILGMHYIGKTSTLMIGSTTQYKEFLDHFCFNVLGLSRDDIVRDGIRQGFRFRYYFDIDVDIKLNDILVADSYASRESNGFKKTYRKQKSIIHQIVKEKWDQALLKYKIEEVSSVFKWS